jgi:hypothetical protein
MRARSAIALVPLLVGCGVCAGCAAARPVPGAGAGAGSTLTCAVVVDPDATGYLGGAPLTAGRAVAMLAGLRRPGWTARIASGTLSGSERGTLDIAATELIGYSGSRLSADAAAFAQAELSYSPEGLPVDTWYARPLVRDITALARDCPSVPGFLYKPIHRDLSDAIASRERHRATGDSGEYLIEKLWKMQFRG